MVRAFPKQERERKRSKRIKDICSELDLPSVVHERATKMFNEFNVDLCKIRPIDHTLIACVIVAAKSTTRLFFPMSYVESKFHDVTNMSDLTKRICKIVGINQRTIALNSIPYVVSMLKLPFKYENVVRENYIKIGRLVPSMCSETKLAVSICKTLKDNNREIDISSVAHLTDSTEASIKSFMNKRRRSQATSMNKERKLV